MKIENVEKLVTNLDEKTEHVIHIKILKQALNHRLILKKLHRIIKVVKNPWLKPYIDMKTKLRRKKTQKIVLRKTFSSWWIMQFLENQRKCEKI